jgi:NADPH:quinone reductase
MRVNTHATWNRRDTHELMSAAWLRRFGPPEVLTVEPTPLPSPAVGQVLVHVERSGLTFVETQMRAGHAPFPVTLPMIPGNGVGGRIVATGEDVDAGLLGTTVVSTTGGTGGHAEVVAVGSSDLIALPAGVSLDEGVGLLADGRTAMLLVETLAPAADERVLVLAAGGGVGTLLVQLASARGAVVVGAARGASKLRTVEQLGAAEIVDYSRRGWAYEVGKVDAVFDGVGGAVGRAAFEIVAPGGRLISYGMASGAWAGLDQRLATNRGVRLVDTQPVDGTRSRQLSEAALHAATRGELRPVIGQTFPLASIAEAHAAMEARATVGKTLLALS